MFYNGILRLLRLCEPSIITRRRRYTGVCKAGCRLTLFAPGPACLFPLDYIDNLYIHMAPHLTI